MSKFLKKNNISMIVCDMAGTTINESGIIYDSLFNTLNKLGFIASVSHKKSWYGRDKSEVMKEHIRNINKNVKNCIFEKADELLINDLTNKYFISDKVKLIDEKLPLFCKDLNKNNILVTLNTGYPSILQKQIIEHFNMNDYIYDWISSSDVSKGRPHPYMINELAKRHNIKSKNIAKFGDTINDIKEGKNANCGVVIGVLSGANNKEELLDAGADLILDKITDLE